MNQTQIKETFNTLFEPLGMKTRTFIIEYRDSKNNCFHTEMTGVYIGADSQIAESLINEKEAKGYTAYCVYEILGGYCLRELEELISRNTQMGGEYIKLIYLDKSKEWA